jgi:hypothetical protein
VPARRSRALAALCIVLALALAAAGCGSSGTKAPPGTTISGPGLQTSKPPWRPEYAQLAQRIRMLGLPPAGNERFHIHAMLHVYVDGLLSPVPANIGIDHAKRIETSLHTHDRTGIVHMESSRPHRFTLGDFFMVWGVKLGPAQVGGLKGFGGDKLHFYLNGRPLANPAAHVLRDGDDVVIGYGADESFPHRPSTELLKALKGKNGAALSCSATPRGKKTKSCLAK